MSNSNHSGLDSEDLLDHLKGVWDFIKVLQDTRKMHNFWKVQLFKPSSK